MAQSYDYLSYSIRIFAKKNTKFGVDKPTCLLVFSFCLKEHRQQADGLTARKAATQCRQTIAPDARYRDV